MTVFPALVLCGIAAGVIFAAVRLNRALGGDPDADYYSEHPEWAMWYEGNDSW